MNNPLLSVVIPTYHRNDLLAKCLECLAPGVQTLPADSYEVIVSDDGSKITAEEMIRKQFPWARWVAGPRKGPAANRNRGAKQAQSEWLVFTDDDCLPDPQWLAAYRLALTPDINIYEGRTVCRKGTSSPLDHSPINDGGGNLWSCNMMVSRQLFNEMQGFDESFPYAAMEDKDFAVRALNTNKYLYIPEAIVDHPPRRLPWGNRLARTHESQFAFWHKHNIDFSKNMLLKIILMTRINYIKRHRFSFDSIKAIVSLIVELVVTFSLFPAWKRKYLTNN